MNGKELIAISRKSAGTIFKRIFNRGDDDKIVVSNMRWATAILDQIFDRSIPVLHLIDARRIAISKVINNDNVFLAGGPNFVVIRLIGDTYRENKGNILLFLRNLRLKRKWIERFKGELLDYTLNQLARTETEFGSQETFKILLYIYAEIIKNTNKDNIVGFIKTPPHSAELRNALNSIRNPKIADNIRRTIFVLTNEESNYLIKYHEEISSWKSKESFTEDIPFFTHKTNSFLYGGDERYLGLLSYFRDGELEKKLKSNPAYLQLMKYYLQLLYLRRIRAKIQTYKTGNWDQFEEIYNNIKKIANTFVKEFGNKDIASELFEEKAEFREYPERWLYDVDKKIAEISSVQYRRTKVVFPFIMEMEIIFNLRINELTSMAKPGINELKDAIKPLIKSEKNSAESILKEASKFRKSMKSRMKNLRKEFDALSNRCIDALSDFTKAKERFNQNITKKMLLLAENALINIRKERPYIQNSLETIGTDLEVTSIDPIRDIALLFDFSRASIQGVGASYNLRSIGRLFIDKNVLDQINELKRYVDRAETEYHELNLFIEKNLGFLVQQSKNQQYKGDDYGRSKSAA